MIHDLGGDIRVLLTLVLDQRISRVPCVPVSLIIELSFVLSKVIRMFLYLMLTDGREG